MRRFAKRLLAALGSRGFYVGLLVFFVLQAAWMALSAVYPMAFDEDFHLGVISVYSEHWLPFLTSQPDGADAFGALVHDPSYLYHYLMSFPYRLLTGLTDSEAVQVVVLRGLNIAMFTAGLVLFAKVLRRVGASRLLANTCLALVVLVPIVPFLAGQINYDNLIMLLLPLLLLAGLDIIDGLKAGKINLKAWLYFALLAMLACLVKYACLPLVLGGVVALGYFVWQAYRGNWGGLWPDVKDGFKEIPLRQKLWLAGGLLLVTVLFSQRYLVNIVQYGTPVPDCAASLSEERCMSYGPWARNTLLAEARPDSADDSVATYMGHWIYGMWFRLFFAVNGPDSLYATRRPLPVASTVALVMAVAATLAAAIFWRRIFRGRAYMGFFLSMIIFYVGVLWLEQYSQFVETGQPVAINGRYLVPVLPLLLLVWGRALAVLLARRAWVKGAVTLAVMAVMAYGGGMATFIVRSDYSWNWPNQAARGANDAARKVLQPILIEGRPS